MEYDGMDCCHVILGRDSGAVCAGMVYVKGGKFIDFINNFSFSNDIRSVDRVDLFFIYLVRERAKCGNRSRLTNKSSLKANNGIIRYFWAGIAQSV
jgi:hypothetical protein